MTTTIDSELTTAIEAIIDRHGEPARSRAEAGVAIEAALGGVAQDIEGVVKDGEVYVVQTRPQV